jgi:hypothetical protein
MCLIFIYIVFFYKFTSFPCLQVGNWEQELAEIEVMTAEGVSSPPQQFHLVGFPSSTTFRVAWEPPTQLRGVLRGYRVTVTPEAAAEETACSNGDSRGGDRTSLTSTTAAIVKSAALLNWDWPPEPTTVNLDPVATTFTFDEGVPGTRYRVSVAALTGAGEGEPAVTAVVTKWQRPSRPPRIVRVRQTITGSVMVEFDYSCTYSGGQ